MPLPESQSYRVPDKVGLAGMVAAVQDTSVNLEIATVIFAGGANFPYAQPNASTPEERGPKVFSNRVGTMFSPAACAACGSQPQWAGKLPYPVGYAACAGSSKGIIIAGGCNDSGHLDKVTRVWLLDGRVRTEELPSLPVPIAYAAYVQVGTKLFVFGGQEAPDATTTLNKALVYDMEKPADGWKELASMPSARMLASAAAHQGKIYVMGGCSLHADEKGQAQRTYLKDVLVYDIASDTWLPEAATDLPVSLVAIPGPIPVIDGKAYVLGGDPGVYYRASLEGKAPEKHPGQSRIIYVYDFASKKWSEEGETAIGVVTAPVVSFDTNVPPTLLIISGETHPGVRTPVMNTILVEK